MGWGWHTYLYRVGRSSPAKTTAAAVATRERAADGTEEEMQQGKGMREQSGTSIV